VAEVNALDTKENLMGKLTVTCFITLDNVVEDPHLWSMDFQSEDTGDYNDAVLRDADAMLLGRKTYEGFAAAWPQRSGDQFSDKFNAMPKHVVTTTLTDPEWNNSHVVSADVADHVRKLKAGQNLLVWGSPTLVQFLADEGLVDEYVLLVSPIFRGEGIRLFGDASGRIDLKVAETTQLSGGMLGLRLTPVAA
jgi:dihydrofolate reductase